jgi:hypothetical protein
MTLREWMTITGTSDRDFAEQIGVARTIVVRYRNGLIRPSWPVLDEIVVATNGAVMPNDFLAASPFLVWPPVKQQDEASA